MVFLQSQCFGLLTAFVSIHFHHAFPAMQFYNPSWQGLFSANSPLDKYRVLLCKLFNIDVLKSLHFFFFLHFKMLICKKKTKMHLLFLNTVRDLN